MWYDYNYADADKLFSWSSANFFDDISTWYYPYPSWHPGVIWWKRRCDMMTTTLMLISCFLGSLQIYLMMFIRGITLPVLTLRCDMMKRKMWYDDNYANTDKLFSWSSVNLFDDVSMWYYPYPSWHPGVIWWKGRCDMMTTTLILISCFPGRL